MSEETTKFVSNIDKVKALCDRIGILYDGTVSKEYWPLPLLEAIVEKMEQTFVAFAAVQEVIDGISERVKDAYGLQRGKMYIMKVKNGTMTRQAMTQLRDFLEMQKIQLTIIECEDIDDFKFEEKPEEPEETGCACSDPVPLQNGVCGSCGCKL